MRFWRPIGSRSPHDGLSRLIVETAAQLLLSRLMCRNQTPTNLHQMQAHRGCGARKIAVGNRLHDLLVVGETVMVGRGARAIGTQTAPDHGTPHRVGLRG